jgi:hypothetical protein
MVVLRNFIAAAALLAIVMPASAADVVGRYQIAFAPTGGVVFLLDTVTGRVWSFTHVNDRPTWQPMQKNDTDTTQQAR